MLTIDCSFSASSKKRCLGMRQQQRRWSKQTADGSSALASYPSPDPNLLGRRLSRGEAQRMESDPFRPLLDKALRETYYPGSTFKIIPALAALEEGLVDPDQKAGLPRTLRAGGDTSSAA